MEILFSGILMENIPEVRILTNNYNLRDKGSQKGSSGTALMQKHYTALLFKNKRHKKKKKRKNFRLDLFLI